ncbi:MAG TPA: hypothetical protein VMJ64_14910 [Anaerolineales bacterium]|nr:hypothetical protein [Anaerolineales bacterium]
MTVLMILLSIPLLLALSTTGALVESLNPDELTDMGVASRS